MDPLFAMMDDAIQSGNQAKCWEATRRAFREVQAHFNLWVPVIEEHAQGLETHHASLYNASQAVALNKQRTERTESTFGTEVAQVKKDMLSLHQAQTMQQKTMAAIRTDMMELHKSVTTPGNEIEQMRNNGHM